MPDRRRFALPLAVALGAFAVLVLGWKAYVAWADVSPFVLPPPEDVAVATAELLAEAGMWHHLLVTVEEIALGFLVATGAGILIGLAVGHSPLLDRAFTPYLVAFQVLPKIAIVPLLLLWLGFGVSSKIAVAALFGLFPVVAGTRAGIRSVEPIHRDLASTLRASRSQRLFLFELPSALPSILTGMEVGIVLATIGAVVAEYIAGEEGLGWLAVASLNQLQIDRLFGVIVLLAGLGAILYGAVLALRRLLVPWHASAAAPASP